MDELELEHLVIGEKGPTIVIEIGIGNSFYNWFSFLEQIKDNYKIVIYHRAGYGNSRASKKQRTVSNIAMELNELIKKLHIEEPFILIGHSFGGLCAQQYAKMFPEKLKGIILVDATSQNFKRLYNLNLPVMYSMISLEKMIESNIDSSKKSKEELYQMFTNMIEEYESNLLKQDTESFKNFITSPTLFRTIANEFMNWERSSQLIVELGEFPTIPLMVIARDKELSAKPFIEHGIPKEEAFLHEEVWRDLQIELSHLTNKGELIIADGSDHEIHKDRPDVIIRTIERMISQL
ncbi:alpha/beta fold hydrolase [Paucisalibacillus globulus]|uniref:alpha/beta fold hydrolase n=1 Tax=Paucisalibacillus globulus TaxID=351095 RepID=UPI000BB935D9|nr:alpha/beta hydrolase [Paucisalibacillus globulus]